MRRLHPRLWVTGAATLAALYTTGTPSVRDRGAEVVAVWNGGSLTRAEHESWRAAHGVETGPEALREHAFVVSLAAMSEERGAGGEPRLRLQLEAARTRVLGPALRRHVLTREIVTAAEIEAALGEQPKAFQRPRKLRLRTIYRRLAADPGKARETREWMTRTHRRLLDGASFEEIARRESESQARFRDGELGYVSLEDLPPEVAEAVRNLEPGEITEPLEHGTGLSIFRCDEIRPANRPGPEEVREKTRRVLQRHRERRVWAAYEEELWRDAAPTLEPESSTPLVMGARRMRAAELDLLIELRAPADRVGDPDVRASVLRGWAAGLLRADRAVELGLDREPRVVEELRWRYLDVLARAELVRRIDALLPEPGESELRERFEADPLRYRQQGRSEIGAIHFGKDSGPGASERVADAQRVVRDIERGAISFEDAARRYSLHHTAEDGGDMGWRTPRQIVHWGPLASRALRQLQVGERSGLLRIEQGLWLFEVRARRPPPEPRFEDARATVLTEWRRQRIHELESMVREEQLARIEVRILPAGEGLRDPGP